MVIVEVLSDSTEKYDRGDKLDHYMTIPTLRDCLRVSQESMLIEHHPKQPDGPWAVKTLGAGERVAFAGIPRELAGEAVYRKVSGLATG